MRDVEISEDSLPMLDVRCPEYFITSIGRVEPAGRDNVRLYCCVSRGESLEPKYTVVVPVEELIAMARFCMRAAADHHNFITMNAHPRAAH